MGKSKIKSQQNTELLSAKRRPGDHEKQSTKDVRHKKKSKNDIFVSKKKRARVCCGRYLDRSSINHAAADFFFFGKIHS